MQRQEAEAREKMERDTDALLAALGNATIDVDFAAATLDAHSGSIEFDRVREALVAGPTTSLLERLVAMFDAKPLVDKLLEKLPDLATDVLLVFANSGLDDDESRRGVLRILVAHGDKIGADEGSVSRVAAQLRSLDERSGGAFWPRLLLSGVGDGSGGGGGGGDDPVDGQQLVAALLRAMPSLGDDVLRACVTAPGKRLLET